MGKLLTPFEPDYDGNVWALFDVETGHTDMGFVELSYNEAGPDSLRGVKEMNTCMTNMKNV